ncbi:hypothetical protein IB642_07290 [Allofrancisella guangzhouensis]|uniref:Uncharacterized protein n=1 Tax=Allofrancisella guangzhouensis TaxID=594679 RepID=A0A0A8E5I4_9GAMM|nr:hypothetical protein [Allofrancisella guangzhouensis]AJC49214.1 hypothetical protein SD28_05990 [Allofrancisella guangzhouensis]MBK2027588.1 hypothetical protein [Allofrancisella guangzhouensis]MBK2044819.1 hypothetical protein [Allofrancisella guangzhouensis]MBK2045023.1 hypothetical protein [Allofrancisella guangzhouensis]
MNFKQYIEAYLEFNQNLVKLLDEEDKLCEPIRFFKKDFLTTFYVKKSFISGITKMDIIRSTGEELKVKAIIILTDYLKLTEQAEFKSKYLSTIPKISDGLHLSRMKREACTFIVENVNTLAKLSIANMQQQSPNSDEYNKILFQTHLENVKQILKENSLIAISATINILQKKFIQHASTTKVSKLTMKEASQYASINNPGRMLCSNSAICAALETNGILLNRNDKKIASFGYLRSERLTAIFLEKWFTIQEVMLDYRLSTTENAILAITSGKFNGGVFIRTTMKEGPGHSEYVMSDEKGKFWKSEANSNTINNNITHSYRWRKLYTGKDAHVLYHDDLDDDEYDSITIWGLIRKENITCEANLNFNKRRIVEQLNNKIFNFNLTKVKQVCLAHIQEYLDIKTLSWKSYKDRANLMLNSIQQQTSIQDVIKTIDNEIEVIRNSGSARYLNKLIDTKLYLSNILMESF